MFETSPMTHHTPKPRRKHSPSTLNLACYGLSASITPSLHIPPPPFVSLRPQEFTRNMKSNPANCLSLWPFRINYIWGIMPPTSYHCHILSILRSKRTIYALVFVHLITLTALEDNHKQDYTYNPRALIQCRNHKNPKTITSFCRKHYRSKLSTIDEFIELYTTQQFRISSPISYIKYIEDDASVWDLPNMMTKIFCYTE